MTQPDLEKITQLSKNYDLQCHELHKLYELKTFQLVRRDEKNGKIVDYMNPQEQYKRALNMITNYVEKTYERVN